MKEHQFIERGFSLIELLIAVAIVGILLTIAMSQLNLYFIRAQVSESLSLMAAMKTTAGEYYNHTGSYPANNSVVGMADPEDIVGNYVVGVDINVAQNNIQATFGDKAHESLNGHHIRLTAVITGQGIVRYQCRAPTISSEYLPSMCR